MLALAGKLAGDVCLTESWSYQNLQVAAGSI